MPDRIADDQGRNDVWFGRRDGILARRKALWIRILVAGREQYRRMVEKQIAEKSGTPRVQLSDMAVSSPLR